MNALLAYLDNPANRYVDRWALAAVLVLALVVRLHGIAVPAIWYDEAFSVLLARHEPGEIWSITARDVHPPLYYLLLHYWMILWGDGAGAVRTLSAIADVGTVLSSVKLMSLIASRRATWIAALLLALLPISVRYSQEARMYSLLGFWLMGATVALVCWVKNNRARRFPFIYGLLMSAAFYTHYFAALCVLVHWFYWWWGRQGVFNVLLPVRSWFLVNGAIVLSFVPWLPHLIDHMTGRWGVQWIPPVTADGVFSLVWQFVVMNNWGAHSLLLRLLPTVLAIVCAVMLVQKSDRPHRYSWLLIGYFFIPVIVLSLVALVVPIFVPRYVAFAAVGLPLFVSMALDAMARRSALSLALAIIVTIQAQGLRAVYQQADGVGSTSYRNESRLDGLAAGIRQAAQPDDEILVGFLLLYLPFSYYNRTGIQPKIFTQEARSSTVDILDRNGYALIPARLKENAFTDLERMKNPGHRVWWITFNEDAVPLSKEDWEHTLTLADGNVVAYLFIPKATIR
ncbi:glycosyltransferase family 39 protein [Pseudomonas sp. RGM2987]|uniref:glycosyltransferase family 39 protein n=1 Tax=Pseudomonas sp. RGM2987 TaxID=2930090 RepID=UPI001FD68A6F|nr:glycosyltransferase family 39 protein [Pseudomonas sp. RGM2987]MCJ8205581.1 glycosyltransferase family 39 protein [Pseudomonas sp. RGM2987]